MKCTQEDATHSGVEESEDDSFELGPEEEAALLEAIAEADAGDFISGDEFLEELRRQRRP